MQMYLGMVQYLEVCKVANQFDYKLDRNYKQCIVVKCKARGCNFYIWYEMSCLIRHMSWLIKLQLWCHGSYLTRDATYDVNGML